MNFLVLICSLAATALAAVNIDKNIDHSLNVQLKIALKPKAGGLEKLHKTILEVSTPKSKSFRKVCDLSTH